MMRSVRQRLASIIVTSLGLGYIPLAPGTWGAAIGILFFTPHLYGKELPMLYPIYIAVFLTFVGYWAMKQLPSEAWETDDSRIVIDETVGLVISMMLVPVSWYNLLLAFVLFRFYDIVKPLGVRYFDGIKAHWAVIADDILAGVYACLTIHFLSMI